MLLAIDRWQIPNPTTAAGRTRKRDPEDAMAPRHFESIAALKDHIGQELAVSDWLTVTQQHITTFAEATDDRQWIHIDPERAARESPYGGTIAHGFLTLSLLAPLFASALSIGATKMSVNYGFNRIRFTAPVLSGDRIRARFRLREYAELDPGGQITWSVVIERADGDKPALIAEWIMRCYP
jgi:acyl dehydratase